MATDFGNWYTSSAYSGYTTITTGSTNNWYMNPTDYGYYNQVVLRSTTNPPIPEPPLSKSKPFKERLEEEIKNWHGNILKELKEYV